MTETHSGDRDITSTDAWIMYVDLYGFSAQVQRDGDAETFYKLNTVAKEIRKIALARELTPFVLSDSIFIVAPTAQFDKRDFQRFFDTVRDLQDELVDHDFLPRGGIVRGPVHLSDRVVVGKPVIQAVRLEQLIAIPCVFLPERERPPMRLAPQWRMEIPTKSFGLVRGFVIAPRTVRPYKRLVKKKLDEALLEGPDRVAAALKALDTLLDAWSS